MWVLEKVYLHFKHYIYSLSNTEVPIQPMPNSDTVLTNSTTETTLLTLNSTTETTLSTLNSTTETTLLTKNAPIDNEYSMQISEVCTQLQYTSKQFIINYQHNVYSFLKAIDYQIYIMNQTNSYASNSSDCDKIYLNNIVENQRILNKIMSDQSNFIEEVLNKQ